MKNSIRFLSACKQIAPLLFQLYCATLKWQIYWGVLKKRGLWEKFGWKKLMIESDILHDMRFYINQFYNSMLYPLWYEFLHQTISNIQSQPTTLSFKFTPPQITTSISSRSTCDIGIIVCRSLKSFILPITLSMCILRWASCLDSSTSFWESWFSPLVILGTFRTAPLTDNSSWIKSLFQLGCNLQFLTDSKNQIQ